MQWDQLPAWLAEYESEVASSSGPDGAAVYSAIVTGRSITDNQEASIALSYTTTGDNAKQTTSEKLSLIEALQPQVCGQLVGESPQTTLDQLLPNGTKVLVIDDKEGSGTAAFMHVIPPDAAAPAEQPPQGSVNEALVATGTWIPSNAADGRWFQDPWANVTKSARWTAEVDASLSATQSRYAPLILRAANDSWTSTPQGQVCEAFRQEERRQEEERRERDRLAAEAQLKAAAEAERQRQEAELLAQQEAERQRQAELAQQWTAPAPAPQSGGSGGSNYSYQPDTTPFGTPCGPGDRDGDGDGVCNESR